MVYVYILKSLVDNGYYIGISGNIKNRLREHNQGKVRSTNKRRPLELIYTEKFNSYSLAREREKEIKQYKGGNEFKKLINIFCRVV